MKHQPRILCAETNPEDQQQIAQALTESSVRLYFADSLDAFFHQLEERSFDLILTEYHLGSSSFPEMADKVRELQPMVPVLVVSSLPERSHALPCLDAGALDYISKSKLFLLPSALERAGREKEQLRRNLQVEEELRRANERLRSILRLRKSQAQDIHKQFRLFFDLAPIGIIMTDEFRNIIDVNACVIKFLGYSKEHLCTLKTSDITHPEDRPADNVVAQYDYSHEDSQSNSYEKRYIKADGEIVWVKVTRADFLLLEDGKRYRLGIVEDVTVFKNREKEMKEREDELTSLLSSLDDIIFELDKDTRFRKVWVSDERKLLKPSSEFIGQKLHDIVPAVAEIVEPYLEDVFNFGEVKELEYHLDFGTDRKYFFCKITRVISKLNAEPRISVLVQDITRRKQIELEVQQAYEMEKSLIALKSRFVNMASHEFRTPLAAIRSSMDIMLMVGGKHQDLEEWQPVLRHIQKVNHEVDRLTNLMNDILILGKLEVNKMPFNPAPLAFQALVKESIRKNLLIYPSFEVIRLEVVGKEKPIIADAVMVNHILDNLISNALKYSEGCQSPVIQLNYSSEAFLVCIDDHGIGIPEDELAHLGESFFRASNALQIPGTGLGLVLVDNFIKIHKGSVKWENKVEGGVRVTLTFPTKVEIDNG